jgi:hypothetical protein
MFKEFDVKMTNKMYLLLYYYYIIIILVQFLTLNIASHPIFMKV